MYALRFGLQNLHTLYHALLKAWLLAWPLAFPGGMVILQYCATEKGFVTRIRVFFRRIFEYWRPSVPDSDSSLYRHYRTTEEEAEYWRSAARLRRALGASDANARSLRKRCTQEDEDEDEAQDDVPLVRYYTPKLLPTYREEMGEDPEAKEVYVHPKAYCKWHRMVFRGPVSLLGIYSWLL